MEQYPGQLAEKSFNLFKNTLEVKYGINYKKKATDEEFDKLNDLRIKMNSYRLSTNDFLNKVVSK